MNNVEQYRRLKERELELQVEITETQNPALEEERIRVALEREHLLFDVLTDAEVMEI